VEVTIYTHDQITQIVNGLNEIIKRAGRLSESDAHTIARTLSVADKENLFQWKEIFEKVSFKYEDIAKIQRLLAAMKARELQQPQSFKSMMQNVDEVQKATDRSATDFSFEKEQKVVENLVASDTTKKESSLILQEALRELKFGVNRTIDELMGRFAKGEVDKAPVKELKTDITKIVEGLIAKASSMSTATQEVKPVTEPMTEPTMKPEVKPLTKPMTEAVPVLEVKPLTKPIVETTGESEKPKEIDMPSKPEPPKKQVISESEIKEMKKLIAKSIPKVIDELKKEFGQDILDFEDQDSREVRNIKSWLENHLDLISGDEFIEISDLNVFINLIVDELAPEKSKKLSFEKI